MIVSAIVAMSKNRVIGKGNDLPWHLPAEMKFFKETTSGHPIIMGRNTFKSIFDRAGKPLPNRTNIIVSRSMHDKPEGFLLANELEDAINLASLEEDEEVFVIGGAQLYSSGLNGKKIDRIYLTIVDAEIQGDTYFPELSESEWTIQKIMTSTPDEKNKFGFSVYKYDRLIK